MGLADDLRARPRSIDHRASRDGTKRTIHKHRRAMMTARINGATRLYGIIAIRSHKSGRPKRSRRAYTDAGINAVMLPIQVLPENFELCVRGLMALAILTG